MKSTASFVALSCSIPSAALIANAVVFFAAHALKGGSKEIKIAQTVRINFKFPRSQHLNATLFIGKSSLDALPLKNAK
jgi:hypothetical protein